MAVLRWSIPHGQLRESPFAPPGRWLEMAPSAVPLDQRMDAAASDSTRAPSRRAAADDVEDMFPLERDDGGDATAPCWSVGELPEVLRACAHFVARVLRAYGVPEADLDDCVQQVALTLARRIADVRRGSERAFLFRVAHRIADHHRRGRARRQEVALDDLSPSGGAVEGPSPGPDDEVARRRAMDTLSTVLETMPEELQAVFVLTELEELSKSEAARALGIPEGTVASRLRRAREAFRAGLALRLRPADTAAWREP